MTTEWEPENFQDEYRVAVLAMIKGKLSKGAGRSHASKQRSSSSAPTINFMDVLKKSVASKSKPKRTPSRKRTTKKTKAS